MSSLLLIQMLSVEVNMLKTGSSALDKMINNIGLVSNRSVINQLQTSIEITSNADKFKVAVLLRQSNLKQIPHCFHISLSESSELTRYLHRISLPNGEPLCWLLMTETGELVEQAFCKHNRNYKSVCRIVISHLLSQSRITNASVA